MADSQVIQLKTKIIAVITDGDTFKGAMELSAFAQIVIGSATLKGNFVKFIPHPNFNI